MIQLNKKSKGFIIDKSIRKNFALNKNELKL